MKQGRPLRAGTGIGVGQPRKYDDDLRARLKRLYLIHRTLGYIPRERLMEELGNQFNLSINTVEHLLRQEGMR